MGRFILSVAGLCLVASVMSANPVAAQQVTPITATTPKPLDLLTYQNRAFEAYTKALAEKKYTLLLFSRAHRINAFGQKMEKNLGHPDLAIYSPFFVAALIDEDKDVGGKHLASALNIQRYPTVIILKTDMDRLHVVGRIEGVFGVDDIDRVLRESLKETRAKSDARGQDHRKLR